MSTELGWARLTGDGPYPLRRGAWYPVITFTGDQVVIEVHHKPVNVPRSAVELVAKRSRSWAVVPRPLRAVMLPEMWGNHYGVCPNCRHRAPLLGSPQTMHCPRCYGRFPIGWEETPVGPFSQGPRNTPPPARA